MDYSLALCAREFIYFNDRPLASDILSKNHCEHESISKLINGINPYKHIVLFVGHGQTVQTPNAASDQDLHCLLSCEKIPPKNPYNGNGLVQLIKLGNSIRIKWVKQIKDNLTVIKQIKGIMAKSQIKEKDMLSQCSASFQHESTHKGLRSLSSLSLQPSPLPCMQRP